MCMALIPRHLEVKVALLRSRPLEDGIDSHDVRVAVAVNDGDLLQARLQVRGLPDGVLLDGIMRREAVGLGLTLSPINENGK